MCLFTPDIAEFRRNKHKHALEGSVQIELESPKQLADRIGWPERRIRNLIAAKKLRHHRVGGSILIPTTAFTELLQQTEIEPCNVVTTPRNENDRQK
jgi:excisionase family DNA binding protein